MPTENHPPPGLTDAEIETLRRAARDAEREGWLRERNAKINRERWESVKSWGAGLGAIVAFKGILWDPLKDLFNSALSHFK